MTQELPETTLAAALQLHTDHGWALIPAEPESKAPLLRGMFDAPPHSDHAIRDAWARAQWRIDQPDNPQWHGRQPNLLLHLGASGMLIVDADTPEEVEEWQNLCAAHGFDPGPPTVCSAGATNADGSVRHHNGGHWYFDAPADLVLPGALNLRLTTPDRPGVFLQGGKRVAMAPPSFRNGKHYRPGGGPWRRPLPPFLRERIDTDAVMRQTGPRLPGDHHTCPAEARWAEATAILDLLPPGWRVTGADGECEVLAHPDASSPRSAVHHATGCSHLPHSDIPLVVIFSTGVGDWMAPLVEYGTPVTVSKLRLLAARDFGGDLRAARKAMGFQGSVGTPIRFQRSGPPVALPPPPPAAPAPVVPASVPSAAAVAVAAPAVPVVTPDLTPAPRPVDGERDCAASAAVVAPAEPHPTLSPESPAPAPAVAPTTTPAPLPPSAPARAAAPTRWAVPPTQGSALFDAAVQSMRNRALPATDNAAQVLADLRDGRSWEREAALRWLYNTAPHLSVAEVSASWGIDPAAALPLLRLAALRLENEVLTLERVGGPADLADHPGDPATGVPPWFDPLAYREAKSPEKVRADRGATPQYAAFYCFRLDDRKS